MPNTTNFEFGDIVLVPFPFTDQSATKKRPAVIVSSAPYHLNRPDLILMPITSQVRPQGIYGDIFIKEWSEAGLLKPSAIKPIIATVEKGLILKKLGKLTKAVQTNLRELLHKILG